MYNSVLIRSILRPNPGDYVHITVLQQALNGIKFSDPFFSSLLFYAGMHYGKFGADYDILQRILSKVGLKAPLEFEDACNTLREYFNDPATILTRLNGRVHLKMIDVETALLQIEESAISSGLSFEIGGALMFDVDKEKAVLCDFTAGFIQGRLEKLLDEPVRVKETNCISLGVSMCEFTIEVD